MKNIFYEYHRDKSTNMAIFYGKNNVAKPHFHRNLEIMVDILQYINMHYKEPLTLEGVASAFGYNKYYFSRIFNRYIGESLSNYINVVRVQNFMRAANEEKNPQISRLAEECGFESMPTFYRAFEKLYGESPKKYFGKN